MSTAETQALLMALRSQFSPEVLLTDPADCHAYAYDNSRRAQPPAAVILARDVDEVIALVDTCRRQRSPLTVRGRGTNTVGATVPLQGGVVLSLERMQKILDYSPADRSITVEAGCLNGAVQTHVRADNLFWPPDPTSAPYSSIGGNLGCNAGGPQAVRYGTSRDNILGLEAVLGTGRLIRVGSRTTKSVVGLDLTRLLVGSEGTLGIITQATLKLAPLPQARRDVRAEFASVEQAAQAVSILLRSADAPAACEFMDDRAVELVRDATELHPQCRALLLLQAHGRADAVGPLCRQWQSLLSAHTLSWQEADDPAAVAALWQARKALSPRLRLLAPNKTNEDVVVPVSRIPALVARIRELSMESSIPIVCFGHAGNGNLHVNLMYDQANPQQMAAHDACLEGVFAATIALGGSLSGEHGIGLAKRDFVHLELDADTRDAMHAVKAALDPDNILNPDKGLPPRR